MIINFSGEIWYWKGPSPFYFITVPAAESKKLREVVSAVTYGWGMVPVEAKIGSTCWKTALWPKDGLYILPIKDKVRKAESLDEGSTVKVVLEVVKASGSS